MEPGRRRLAAWLTVTGPDGRKAVLYVHYRDYVPHALAYVDGTFGGRRVAAVLPAP